jgi:integrase
MNVPHIGKVPRINPVIFAADHRMEDEHGNPTTLDDGPGCTELVFRDMRPALSLERVGRDYIKEHVLVAGGDVARVGQALRDWFSALDPQRDVTTLTRADGRAVVDRVTARGNSPATARRIITVGAAALNHAKREERLLKVPKFQMPASSSPRAEWLTREQVATIMEAPKPERLHRFFMLAFGTGARAQAIEQVKWSAIDWDARSIDYRTPGVNHKNKRRVVAPLSDKLYAYLREEYARRQDDYVIGLGPSGRCTSCYHLAARLMKQLAILVRAPRHICRHTFVSWLLQGDSSRGIAPTPIHIVALLVGDTIGMLERVYGHIGHKDLLRAVNGL